MKLIEFSFGRILNLQKKLNKIKKTKITDQKFNNFTTKTYHRKKKSLFIPNDSLKKKIHIHCSHLNFKTFGTFNSRL